MLLSACLSACLFVSHLLPQTYCLLVHPVPVDPPLRVFLATSDIQQFSLRSYDACLPQLTQGLPATPHPPHPQPARAHAYTHAHTHKQALFTLVDSMLSFSSEQIPHRRKKNNYCNNASQIQRLTDRKDIWKSSKMAVIFCVRTI